MQTTALPYLSPDCVIDHRALRAIMSDWRPCHRRTASLPVTDEMLEQRSNGSDDRTDTTSLYCDVGASARMEEHEQVSACNGG